MARFMQYIPMLAEVEADVIRSFRKGGGVPYERYPRFQALMAESSGLRFDHLLLQKVVPLAGSAGALDRGIDVLDIGCGQGHAVNLLARAFPKSRFTGYDFSETGVAAARAEAEALANANVTLRRARRGRPRRDGALRPHHRLRRHPRPGAAARRAARGLAGAAPGRHLPDGRRPRLERPPGQRRPPAGTVPLRDVHHALHDGVAGLGGAGLGTAWGEQKALAMLREAGLASVAIHRLGPDDPLNNYYSRERPAQGEPAEEASAEGAAALLRSAPSACRRASRAPRPPAGAGC